MVARKIISRKLELHVRVLLEEESEVSARSMEEALVGVAGEEATWPIKFWCSLEPNLDQMSISSVEILMK